MSNQNYESENLIVMRELSKRNPYIQFDEKRNTLTIDENYRTINLENDENIVLNEYNYNNAIEIEKRLCPIKFICFLDIVLNFFYLINGYLLSGIFFVFSVYGYIATNNYNKNYMIGYLMYQVIQILFKIFLLILTITITFSTKFREKFEENTNYISLPNNYTELIVVYTLLLILQVCIYNYILNFYRLLPPTNSNNSRFLI